MSFNISTIPPFERAFKRLLKKYPSLKNDLSDLLDLLQKNPAFGKPLGKNCYKIRMAISSKTKGKSGGGRVITMVRFENERIVLLTMYDKSEADTLEDSFLNNLIKLADQLL